MPRTCSVCAHPKRADIDKALVANEPLRNVAKRYGTSATALHRHKRDHLAELLAQAVEVQRGRDAELVEQRQEQIAAKEAVALDVMDELKSIFHFMHKLAAACDDYLTDPDDPTRYDLGPRASEVTVHYEDIVIDDEGEGHIKRRKAKLSELLDIARERTPDRTYTLIETKFADPRKLIVSTAARLHAQIELLAKLIGQLDERPLNIVMAPEWSGSEGLRTMVIGIVTDMLRGYDPDAVYVFAERLAALEAG